MTGTPPLNAHSSWRIAIVVALLAATTLAFLNDDSFMANDAAQYMESASNLRAGKGYSTSLLYYDQNYDVGGLPATQTVWPPLFPALITLTSVSGLSVDQAAFFVSLVSYLLIPLLLLATLRRIGHAPGSALMLSCLWYLFALPWGNVLNRLSDLTFALFTVLTLYCLVAGSEQTDRKRTWLVLAGVAAALAFATRYAGIFFIASIGLFYGLCFLLDKKRFSLADFIALMITPVLIVAAFFVNNYLRTGGLTGGADPHQGGSIGKVLDKLLTLVSKVFGFSDNGFMGAWPAEMLFLVFVLVSAVYLFIRRHDLKGFWSRLFVPNWHRASQLSLWYIVFTLGVLSFFGLTKLTAYLHPRYMIPLIPFAILVFAEIRLPTLRGRGSTTVLARVVVLCGIAAFLAGQLNVARAVWAKGTSDSLYLALTADLKTPMGSGTAGDFLRANSSLESPILANESQMLGYILERPVLGTSPANYSARIWDVAAIRRICKQYQVGYVVFFRDQFDKNNRSSANLQFLFALDSGQNPIWLDRVLETESLHLYRVNHDLF